MLALKKFLANQGQCCIKSLADDTETMPATKIPATNLTSTTARIEDLLIKARHKLP
jgi:uncharacterized cysteine cluster protein YcgN (CxxCxxCC family)